MSILKPHEHVQRSCQSQSPLFKLPVELRMQIYEYALYLDDHKPTLRDDTVIFPPVLLPWKRHLLRTCHSVKEEAYDLAMSINWVFFSDATTVSFWSARTRAGVEKVMFPASSPAALLRVLEGLHLLPNVRELCWARCVPKSKLKAEQWVHRRSEVVRAVRRHGRLEKIEIIQPLDEKGCEEWEFIGEVDEEIQHSCRASCQGPLSGSQPSIRICQRTIVEAGSRDADLKRQKNAIGEYQGAGRSTASG